MKRSSGILYPILSLPSKYGIGCFSKEAYEFVDFLEKSGQSYWQILPIGPTGFGDSPYQSLSSFAGNPYFIDLETLIKEGLLSGEECDSVSFGSDPARVDYGALYENRSGLLKKAFDRFMEQGKEKEEYLSFKTKNAYWLDDFSLFSALKDAHGGAQWTEWEPELVSRSRSALKEARGALAEEIEFYMFRQYEFEKQWQKLRGYAAEKKIKIIGDMPLYVALDSADAWANPEQFFFDRDHKPIDVAGTPPDTFSASGQRWGNPLYDWNFMKIKNYDWWVSRMARGHELYDVIRLDHFNGLDSYYAIPYRAKTAEHGKMKKGPGIDLFRAVKEQLGDIPIIAEDLGNITDSIRKMVRDSGFPGMKVLQFAFDWSESSDYLPYRHIHNCVVYTGTHDNPTTRAWIESISDHDRDYTRRYINSIFTDYGQFVWDFIREAQRSVADLCIIPIQDYLVLGNEARMNTPGTAQGNWQWRTVPGQLSEELAKSIREMTKLYGRLPG
ncbi:MAG: 4-alpha-glucanotransferase [Bilifractor sp.]